MDSVALAVTVRDAAVIGPEGTGWGFESIGAVELLELDDPQPGISEAKADIPMPSSSWRRVNSEGRCGLCMGGIASQAFTSQACLADASDCLNRVPPNKLLQTPGQLSEAHDRKQHDRNGRKVRR